MNEFPVVFEPEFMTIYLLVIICIFSTTLALSLEKYKFTIAGKALIGMCFISLFVLFVYIWVGGISSETNELILSPIGILSVLLFTTHPYIFLILAILLGGEKKPPHVSKLKK
ncbi:hypothetical protein CW829_00575 [Listeria monocytogenes]|nr:hypothetical protein [Listeria monocytogenes]EAG9425633.1 hypothetical protein [Listeria monocytogenes]EHC2200469.1 hypothetical protein [Listeria monocytogenes]EHH6116778.1 hypothetical protein [Listeria monocytogenes]EIO5735736.1 hypothetical protein [Listeria monocytogenes]